MKKMSTFARLGLPLLAITVAMFYAGNRAGAMGPTQVQFGGGAVFPSVSLLNYNEKIGVVPLTQLHFAGADVTLRISNKGKTPTDPMWLNLKDNNLLMRQNTPRVSLPSLKPGASQTVMIHLDAILPPPTSQMPQEKQYSQWDQKYKDNCGVELRTVMDWRGPQSQTPIDDHQDTVLTEDGFNVSANSVICADKQCVKPCQIAKNVHQQLDGHAVGYAFFVGQYPKFDAGGQARTSADGPERDFTPSTKITVASVSKMVTAIAAVRILAKHGVQLNQSIGQFLPSDWMVSQFVKDMTFEQLLSQSSGIRDYGNGPNDYAGLKKFFTQTVTDGAPATCDPKDGNGNLITLPPGQGMITKGINRCYSNYNFGIFRILLPKIAGLPEDKNLVTRPQTLADQYVKLVQQNVFDLVGQPGVSCKPPTQNPAASSYAFAYRYPGSKSGFDWVDNSLGCGAAGWYLSVEDISKVLISLNAGDGKILTKDQVETMRQKQLGWDVDKDTEVEKNGGWGARCDAFGKKCETISTSVAIFGPVTGPRVIGVLFINSDISGGPSNGGGAAGVLENAYKNALSPK